MAEAPEHLFRATFPKGYKGRGKPVPPGDPVGAGALLLLVVLWRWVPSSWRARGGKVFMWREGGIQQLAKDRGIGTRAVEEQLRQLQAAELIEPGKHSGKAGFFLLLGEGAAEGQAKSEGPIEKSDRSYDRRSPIIRSAATDHMIGVGPIIRSVATDHMIGRLKEELGIELGIELEEELEARLASSLSSSKDLLQQAPTPEGVVTPLARSSQAVLKLAALLMSGEAAEAVAELLGLAPAIIAAGYEPMDWYGAEMFVAGAWVRWCRNGRKIRGDRRVADETRAAEARLQAEAQERALAAAKEREAFEAGRLQREREASVLLSWVQESESAPKLSDVLPSVEAMRFLGRDRQVERDEAAEIEARRALNRYLSELRTAADRPLTPQEAQEARQRFAELHRARPAAVQTV